MVKDLFNVIGPYIHLESLHSTQFHLPFHLHFINHWEPKLRQTYQPANGGPVPACTPWHTWISLITSLALPDYSRLYSVVDCQLDCMCVSFKSWSSRRVRVCVCVRVYTGGCLTLDCAPHSWITETHLLQFQPCPVIETVSRHPAVSVPPGISLNSNQAPVTGFFFFKKLDQRSRSRCPPLRVKMH